MVASEIRLWCFGNFLDAFYRLPAGNFMSQIINKQTINTVQVNVPFL